MTLQLSSKKSNIVLNVFLRSDLHNNTSFSDEIILDVVFEEFHCLVLS